MKKNEIEIIEAAIRVLSRYGVKRTTMNDIAEEAGVVRQTLYNLYKNKNDVLRGTTRYVMAQMLEEIQQNAYGSEKLSDQLDVVFNVYAIQSYEMVANLPDAKDILSGVVEIVAKEKAEAIKLLTQEVINLLSPYKAPIEANGLDIETYADFIMISLSFIKMEAKSRGHLDEYLSVLKANILVVCQSS
ncbi:TetR/AcrR family transcriptional regulator [Curvivirga aplysinae]|uniref:TetR/AcrR family transcriptional regulator n=1 Tax=Curvivirga aplysinae TaxID=2529852 RepID=UPI0012BB5199|nr:TetR/AcrR family transcriptional regulator [Curvivirga aplysinae]MTI10303.1 TetR/AcrR family transcriptional regulator [Curvivirga aplysinae]